MLIYDIRTKMLEIEEEIYKYQANKAREMLAELMYTVLKTISRGQCKDYPPEDFAEEAVRCCDKGNKMIRGMFSTPDTYYSKDELPT
jgi:hypothetical protein